MTRKEALQALLDKIVAFKPDNPHSFQHLPDSDYKAAFGSHWEHAARANRHDMNAARSLHEAVLPGEPWMLWRNPDDEYGCNIADFDTGYAADPAVAWLIALITGEIARCE